MNLCNHLRISHSSLYYKLFANNSRGETSLDKQEKVDKFFSSTPVDRLPSSSQLAKSLTDAVSEFVVRDMRRVSVVDGVAFMNLIHVAEHVMWYHVERL